MNNGWKSNFFLLQRGLRQGCPSSALIFIIVAEIMAFNIRNDNNLHGIKVKHKGQIKSIKITQLADDTTIFLGSKNEVMTALNIIENFGKHSGLMLNQGKTEGIYLGKLKNCTEQIGNINWEKKLLKLWVFILD